jgi:undecaprenyl-diphosphatase
MKRWMKVILFLWAASIGLAQIYVGVHYPSDILGGMILGAIIAWLVCKLAFVLGLKTSMS